jgi:hypothetical protein
MPDEPKDITVDAAKFDRILGRMLNLKPLTKAEISARIKAERGPERAAAYERYKKIKESKNSKKLGQ